jgi:hypothetical protein
MFTSGDSFLGRLTWVLESELDTGEQTYTLNCDIDILHRGETLERIREREDADNNQGN